MRLSCTLLFVLGLAGCTAGAEVSGPPGTDALTSPSATRVEVVTVRPSTASLSLSVPGEVIGARDVLLAAGNGGLVERVDARRGHEVKKGASLVRVDTALYGAQLALAEAQSEQAEAEAERQRRMGELGSPQALLNAETQAKVAKANLDQARARYARAHIRAPFAGTVADVMVEEGSNTTPGAPVARITMLDPVRIRMSVSDRDVVSLEEGMPIQVQTHARSEVFEGEVTLIAAAADLSTRAFTVEAHVPNPDKRLLPGMIAQVHLERTIAEDTVVVPQDWIVTRRTDRGVFVVDDEGNASWRSVHLGDVARDQVVVTSGLEVGDRVVITGHRELVDGDALLVAREGTCCTNGRPTWGE